MGASNCCDYLCKYSFFFFFLIKAGHPIATRLCNLNENGEITLEEAIIGSCNENLESLEKQVCHMAHVMATWKKNLMCYQCFLKLSN